MAKTVKSESKRAYNATLRNEVAQLTRQRAIDAARRLLVRGTYSSVTMDDIASEAGVAYQTVYSVFGTKLRLAQAMIDAGPHVDGLDDLIAESHESTDLEVGCRIGAQIVLRSGRLRPNLSAAEAHDVCCRKRRAAWLRRDTGEKPVRRPKCAGA